MSETNDAALPAPGYAAVIIAYRRPDLVRAVLERLQSQTHKPELIVVVDNGGDLHRSSLGGHTPEPEIIRRPDNPGYAVAVNVAADRARQAGLRNLLVLTHDAEFAPTLATSLLAGLRLPRAGCVAPTLRWVSRPERIFSSGGVLTSGGRAYHRTDEISGNSRAVQWVDGAVALFRLDALDDVGGVDERYFLYFEDVDTGWSLARAGWRTFVVAESAQQEPGAHPLRLGLRNMVLFARKADLPALPVALAVARRAAEELVVGLRRDHRLHLLPAIRGIIDGLAGRQGKP